MGHVKEEPIATVETVTILISDLVGSTSLESHVGPARADELRGEHFALLRDAIAQTEGAREVKNTGDGIMVAFPSAAGATECAARMQQSFEARNREADEQLVIRIGISMGDATHEGDDYFGMPSIEAARLCDKAPPAGILVPELVKMMVGGRGGDSFKPAGALELKGIPEPIEAYEVTWEPAGPAELPQIPLPGRLTGVPPLSYVGRKAEVEMLKRLWEGARGGERHVCLVAGEPGIGKTRLVAHAALARRGEEAVVLYGRCEEELATPYGPWIEALGHYVEHGPQAVLEAHVEAHGGELTRLLPGLAARVPDTPAPRETDPETERFLLFAAVAGLLEEASDERPVVLLLDDLHWAGKPTLAMLKHVVGSGGPMSLLLLGTYRDSELSRDHPLTGLLADLRAEQGVERISLEGLDEPDVVAMMEAAAGHEMDSLGLKLAHDIAAETSGNPFFVAEMLRHLTESGQLVQGRAGRWELSGGLGNLGLPQSVREVVGRRIERLGEPVRKTLSAASVIGRDFDVELLLRVTDIEEGDLLDLLEQAVEASVLLERAGRPGEFTFAHALINHTLFEDLSATRRARLHKRIAEALEEIAGSDSDAYVGELAHHWAAATTSVDVSKAISYSRRAGQRALDELAPDEAVRWFTQALELHGQHPGGDEGERCDLLIGLGEARRQVGEVEFRDTLLEASRIARDMGDAERLAAATIANNRGILTTAGLVDDDVVEMLEAALELNEDAAPETRARLMVILALELAWHEDHERRHRLAAEARELAERSGDDRTLAFVLWRRFNAIAVPETLAERTADVKRLEEISERLGDPVVSFWSGVFSTTPAMETADRAWFDRSLARLLEIADELEQPMSNWVADWLRALSCFVDGRLEEAERHAEDAAQAGADGGQADAMAFYVGQLSQIYWAQGRIDEVVELMEQTVEDNPDLSAAVAILGTMYCETDRLDDARALLEPLAADGFQSLPRDMIWLTSMVLWADVAARLDHAEAAATLYEILEQWPAQMPTMSITLRMPVAHYLGCLARTLGRTEDGERHFARALEIEEGYGAPLFMAATRIEWARLLRTGDDPAATERGRALAEEARSAAEQLQAPALARKATELLEPAVG